MAGVLVITALTCTGMRVFGQDGNQAQDYRVLVKKGNEALAHSQWTEAARAFQGALDLNPSSAKANEGLGIALFRQLAAENVGPSAYSDVVERAESHLREASQLSPSASAPLLELSNLEAYVAEHSSDADERNEHYQNAHESLKHVISLEPGKPDIYLRLATLERDEFGPPLQEAKARFAKTAGPIPDVETRRNLQKQYRALIDDAITNARHASEMNGTAQRPLLLLSRLFRDRALIVDTPEQYANDMQAAEDWERQFLAMGGHIGNTRDRNY